MRRRKTFLSGSLAAIAAIACLAVSACTPGVAGSTAANANPSGPATTDPGKLGHVTLRVLDYFTGGVDNTWMNDVIAAFEKKYPNITVQRQSVTWTDLMQELPLKLKSPSPPDIVPPNNGWQSLGTLVQGGLVDDLNSYATAYGWDKSVPASILRQQEFSANGQQMGTGVLFGMPVALSSMIEVYYNRSLLQHLGLSVPTTYNEFVTDLAKAKQAGITPIALGNQGQSGITQPLYSVMDALGDQSVITNFIYSLGQGSLESQASGFPQRSSSRGRGSSTSTTPARCRSRHRRRPRASARSSCRATTASRLSRPCRRRRNCACPPSPSTWPRRPRS